MYSEPAWSNSKSILNFQFFFSKNTNDESHREPDKWIRHKKKIRRNFKCGKSIANENFVQCGKYSIPLSNAVQLLIYFSCSWLCPNPRRSSSLLRLLQYFFCSLGVFVLPKSNVKEWNLFEFNKENIWFFVFFVIRLARPFSLCFVFTLRNSSIVFNLSGEHVKRK